MAPRCIVTIIRHGETAHNALKIVQGHMDTPLNEEGEAQAMVTARYLRSTGVRFDEAWSSDLSRARKTAEAIMSEQVNPVELQLDERIRERYLGEMQGKKWGDPGCDHTTIEDASIFYARLSSFWDDKLFPPTSTPSNSDVPRQILFVSHGGSIRALTLGLTTHRSARYTVALDADEAAIAEGINRRVTNCSITRIAVESVSNGVDPECHWKGVITAFADDSHFADSSRVPSPTGNADIIE